MAVWTRVSRYRTSPATEKLKHGTVSLDLCSSDRTKAVEVLQENVTTCDFPVPSVLNGCARQPHGVTLATRATASVRGHAQRENKVDDAETNSRARIKYLSKIQKRWLSLSDRTLNN